jgi:hypothetical protein
MANRMPRCSGVAAVLQLLLLGDTLVMPRGRAKAAEGATCQPLWAEDELPLVHELDFRMAEADFRWRARRQACGKLACPCVPAVANRGLINRVCFGFCAGWWTTKGSSTMRRRASRPRWASTASRSPVRSPRPGHFLPLRVSPLCFARRAPMEGGRMSGVVAAPPPRRRARARPRGEVPAQPRPVVPG